YQTYVRLGFMASPSNQECNSLHYIPIENELWLRYSVHVLMTFDVAIEEDCLMKLMSLKLTGGLLNEAAKQIRHSL
ncbi:hypothetical protein Tco_1076330, partial [Tanacetum coccineum]